ncbi:SNF2 family N-terminal domain-containing protein [Chlamydoabsidia padenii]|nr:SNF2 family N-terminal domain-containing protein [Chlamydoabsidia padenii]
MDDYDTNKDKPVMNENTVSHTIGKEKDITIDTTNNIDTITPSTFTSTSSTCPTVDQHSLDNKTPESPSSHSSPPIKRTVKLTKRDILIQSKLKEIKVRSLFDTDGDINSHNILQAEDGASRPKRQAQKRKYPDEHTSSSNSPKKHTSSSSPPVYFKTARRPVGRPPGSGKKQQQQQQQQQQPSKVSPPTITYSGKRRGRKPKIAISSPPDNKHGRKKEVSTTSSSLVTGRPKKAAITPLQSAELLMQQRQKSVELLRPTPKTALEKVRNQTIRDRERELQSTLAHHDTLVRELAHMEVYQTIVDYRPDSYSTDERVTKFILDHNLWDKANDYLLKKQWTNINTDRVIRTRPTQQPQVVPLIKMLQHSSELDALSTDSASTSNDTQRQILLRSLPPAAVNTIRSGTGIKKFHRQFSTLDVYLSTFIYLDDNNENDDPTMGTTATKDVVDRYVEKERAIRDRIRQLEETGGGFTTRLKELANRRPQQPPSYLMATEVGSEHRNRQDATLSIHDSIVSQVIIAAKNFHGHTKYRRNAARKCAKAVDKYWDHIHNRDERSHREEIKRLTRLAKWTAHQVRGKWRVVERICDARFKELLKEQQAKKSRRHLEMILEHSEQMLGVRMDELAMNQQRQDSLPDTPQSASLVDQDSDNNNNPQLESTTTSLKSWYNDDESDHVTPDATTPASLNYWTTQSEDGSDSEKSVDADADDDDDRDHIIDDLDDDSDSSAQDEDELLTVEQLRQKYQHYGQEISSDDDGDDSTTPSEIPTDDDDDTSDGFDLKALTSRAFEEIDDNEDFQDSDYSTRSVGGTNGDKDDYNLNMSDDGETEDDDEVLLSLSTEADLPLDKLYAQYPLSTMTNDQQENEGDTGVDNNSDSDIPRDDDNKHQAEETHWQAITTSKIRKASVSLSDIDSGEVRHDKRAKWIDTIASDDATKVDGDVANDNDDDDDRTVTDYGSEAPDDDDQNADTRQQTLSIVTAENETRDLLAEPGATTLQDEGDSEQVNQEAQQPTGTTLSTTKVDTRIPFLLRGTLREYQHVGLDWLASLYNNGLNGILADEMGLGKTIQTIALLASLACDKGIWGPHLVVVPTSVILNWEMEFKRWLPGFKILTYYGNPKERKEKRSGWSKENAFHVCITSYQLVLQDQSAFRRKAWQYLILDEAHHIKNFRSQRWQVLLNFNSRRRLLLTGTPLQNNLMELWSLLYFLMPNGVSASMPIGFANLKEFQEWFSSPVDRMIENQQGMNEESRLAIQKLHTVLRPYLLRRLKVDVEQQMPAKYEHVIYCRLSKRQRYLYDDFMGRAKTKETLASGNFLSIINTLMQLRKVCNHPDLFEERPIVTSFSMASDVIDQGQHLDKLVRRLLDSNNNNNKKDLGALNLIIVQPELEMTASQWDIDNYTTLDCSAAFMETIQQQRQAIDNTVCSRKVEATRKYLELKTFAKIHAAQQQMMQVHRWESIHAINQQRCQQRPLLGAGLLDQCRLLYARPHQDMYFPANDHRHQINPLNQSNLLGQCILGYEDRINRYMDVIERFTFVTPAAVVKPTTITTTRSTMLQPVKDILHPLTSRLQIAFPDKRLLQYDCGKLQRLAILLQQLAAGGHRVLIFTQMTRVLDVLEAFLNMHGHRYLRLDGATKVEQRQLLTEQFNSDKRILCFILSTRSGGLGINLTGADTVIFYDSDWNPSMDKQCQDRAHRIGQLRDVHIYRFVTEYTIEENIFKKANQKRLLDDMVIQEGGFTNDYFQKMDWWKDLPEVTNAEQQQEDQDNNNTIDMEQALLEAEGDEADAQAAIAARNEMTMDDDEFDDKPTPSSSKSVSKPSPSPSPSSPAIQSKTPPTQEHSSEEQQQPSNLDLDRDDNEDDKVQELDTEVGHVDQYMLRFWEREMFGQYLGFGGFPEPVD